MAPYSIPVEEDEVETLLVNSESSMEDGNNYLDDPIRKSPNFASRIRRLSWSIFNLLLVGINLKLFLIQSSRNQNFVLRGGEKKNNDTLLGTTTIEVQQPWNSSSGFQRYEKIFGHVHMAKTAGSEINGELAAHYERVCGHKGYSYDAVQMNKQVEQWANSHHGIVTVKDGGPDLISAKYPDSSRGRVPTQVMREIGFEDCDYVSVETSWQIWKEVAEVWPVELHVPCRDPLEHLMSQCNHRKHTFNCHAPSLAKEVQRCLVGFNRFDTQLMQVDNVTLKCFSPVPMEPYLEYMDQFLERKRVESPYIHRSSNRPRQKDHECIWNNAEVANQVLDHLYTLDYYQWCQECMGSENDRLRLPQ